MDGACGTHGWKINTYGIFAKNPNELEDLDTDGRGIIFQRVLRKQDDKEWDDLPGLGHGKMAGCYECGNELPGSIECGKLS